MAEFEQQAKGWWSKLIAWLRGGQRADAGRKAKAALQDLRDSDVVGKARDTAREAIRDLRDSDAGRKAKAAIRDLRDSPGTGDKSLGAPGRHSASSAAARGTAAAAGRLGWRKETRRRSDDASGRPELVMVGTAG